MIHINWDPIAHLDPVPINWYGLGWAAVVSGASQRAPIDSAREPSPAR